MAKQKFMLKSNGAVDYPKIMLAAVKSLKSLGGTGKIQEIDDRVIENELIDDDEQAEMAPNRSMTKLSYRLLWARSYLKKDNFVENSKNGVWVLTAKGYKIETLEDTETILSDVRKEIAQKKRDKEQQKTSPDDIEENLSVDDELPDESTSLDNNQKDALLKILRGMDGYAFERFCQHLLRELGFSKVSGNEKKGADGGIDGTGILRLNLVSFKVSFQCKCWTDKPISAPEIQKFRGALDTNVDKALFITTSTFTKNAKDEAINQHGRFVIDLIDSDRLYELVRDNELGVESETVKQIKNIDTKWFDRFNLDNPNLTPNPQQKGKK